ncbi:hypothetical protein [Streptomyces daliensis]|uniref:Uncharacterized protein n=1 Tax=Streptomyces daliensis TaxID=299421 RepID=A0A8T4J381_9ACTN|nr:hypothetical protein [Streptomyces daliensis]
MGFDEEWAGLKSGAGQRGSPGTRLNSAGDGGGDNGSLQHVQADKKKAAARIEEHVGPDTRSAGNAADADTEAITGGGSGGSGGVSVFLPGHEPRPPLAIASPGGMRDWDVRTGLQFRKREWDRHLKKLIGRLNSEMSNLRQTNLLFQGTEGRRESGFGLIPGGSSPSDSPFLTTTEGPPGPWAPGRSKLTDL